MPRHHASCHRVNRHRRLRLPLPPTYLAMVLALLLLAPPAPAHTGEHILLARQVDISTGSGAENPAVVLLVSNLGNTDADAPPCHFTGAARAEEATAPFGSGLQELVFQPLSLAPGESLAIDIPPATGGSQIVSSEVRVLVIAVEADDPGLGPCPVLVQALAYEPGTGATLFPTDRFTLGLEKTFLSPGLARRAQVLGAAGGGAGQAIRLVLIAENNSPLPAERCDTNGELIAHTVLRLGAGPSGSDGPIERSWPIKWEGPSASRMALVEIPFTELGADGSARVDALLSVRFADALPAACATRKSGMLSVYDLDTGYTRSVLPTDRLAFHYRYFNN